MVLKTSTMPTFSPVFFNLSYVEGICDCFHCKYKTSPTIISNCLISFNGSSKGEKENKQHGKDNYTSNYEHLLNLVTLIVDETNIFDRNSIL